MLRTRRSNEIAVGILQVIILCFTLVSSISHGEHVSVPIRIFAYQFFAIYLTGYALSRLLKVHVEKISEHIAISYTLGGIVSLITYMVFMLIGFRAEMPIITCFEGVSACVYLIATKNRRKHYEIDRLDFLLCLFALIIFYILATITVSFVNTLPDETGGTGYYVDWPYWVGNNIAFTKAFPNENFRLIGTQYKYHFFSSIFFAQVSLSTGVDIVDISFYYSYLFSGLILVFSAVFFVTRLLKKKHFITLALLIILFSDGPAVTVSWHTLICPFGFDFGYAYSMMAVATLIEIVKYKSEWKSFFPLSVMYLFMTTGSKGSSGLIILTGFGIIAFYWLFHSEIKKGLISGFSWLGVFLIVFFVFLYSIGGSHENGMEIVGFNKIVRSIYDELIIKCGNRVPHFALVVVSVMIYWFQSNLVVTGLICFTVCTIVTKWIKKDFQIIPFSLLMIAIAGMILLVVTEQIGNSQMYFFMGMIPFGTVTGLLSIEEMKKDTFQNIFVLIAAIFFGISFTYYYGRVVPKIKQGIKCITKQYTSDDYPLAEYYAYYYADQEDYDAYIMLKDHTNTNDIIAIDSFTTIQGKECSMLAGIFSERYIWNEKKYSGNPEISKERNEIMKQLNDNPEMVLTELKKNGVKYLLCLMKDETLENLKRVSGFSEIFKNSHYIIYFLQ